MAVKSFRDLEVWQVSMEVVEACYLVTRLLPVEERYGLTQQARRAAVSIPANLAEGHNRRLQKPYRNHVNIALGSQAELETLLELASRLGFIPEASLTLLNVKVQRVGQMLQGLHRSLRSGSSDDD